MSDAVTVRGRGVHGGAPCTVTLHARPGPVRLRRGRRAISPVVSSVVGTRGCTVLGGDGARVGVVEHLTAALHVRGVWSGLLIEVDADELPILDGSAAPWARALDALPPFPAAPAPAAFRGEVRDPATGARASLTTGRTGVVCHVDYRHRHPALRASRWCGGPERWPEVLAARTFGFAHDAERLRAAGLALGASDRNAIVFDDAGPRVPLRVPDEPVRHKVLDALGDLYLLGRPFDGLLTVDRGGHALHHELMIQILTGTPTTDPTR